VSRRLTSRIVVFAVVLFASAWVLCEQLIGLGMGTSIAVGGALVAIVVSTQALWATHPGRQRNVQEKLSVPEHPIRQRAYEEPRPQRPEVLITQHVQLIVDDAGIEVKTRRGSVGGADLWETYLQMRWPTVAAIGFATDRYDPIVCCFVWTVDLVRHHIADSGFLTRPEWVRFGEMIAGATHGRLILDLAARDNPRSVGPDW
jgi:hypothetical protein